MTSNNVWLNRYLGALREGLGLDTSVDDDGIIEIEYRGQRYWIAPSGDGDVDYLCLYTGFQADDGPTAAQLAAIAYDATHSLKLVQVRTRDHCFELTLELLVSSQGVLPTPSQLCSVLPRALESLRYGTRHLGGELGRLAVAAELAGIEAATLASSNNSGVEA